MQVFGQCYCFLVLLHVAVVFVPEEFLVPGKEFEEQQTPASPQVDNCIDFLQNGIEFLVDALEWQNLIGLVVIAQILEMAIQCAGGMLRQVLIVLVVARLLMFVVPVAVFVVVVLFVHSLSIKREWNVVV